MQISRQQRAECFDILHEHTARILQKPAVVEALGALGLDLDIGDQLDLTYLPEVDGDRVLTAGDTPSTARIAVVPLSSAESRRGVVLNRSLFRVPSSKRQRLIEVELSHQHLDSTSAISSIDEAITELTTSHVPRFILGSHGGATLPAYSIRSYDCSQAETCNGPAASQVVTYPTVLLNVYNGVTKQNAHSFAVSMLHELVHVAQIAQAPVEIPKSPEDRRWSIARDEMGAYYVEATAIKDRKLLGSPPLARQVERMRTLLTEPNEPFEPTEQLVRRFLSQGIIT